MRTLNSNRQKHINHYKCFIHNHLRAANIKAPPGKNRKKYTRILASRLRDRMRMELSRLRVTAKSRDHYHSRAENAITNVLDCFHGNHSNCRKVSAVCISHIKTYMKLSMKDRETRNITEDDKYPQNSTLTQKWLTTDQQKGHNSVNKKK